MGRPRESYVRVTIESHGYTIEPAIEWRNGDAFDELAQSIGAMAFDVATAANNGELTAAHQMAVAEAVAHLIARAYPDRHYFVEVWQAGQRGFAQTYQPFDIPRDLEREALRKIGTITRRLLTWLGEDISENEWLDMHEQLVAIESLT